MNDLARQSPPAARRWRFWVFTAIALAGLLCSCAGPTATREATGTVRVKTGPMHRVTVTVQPDNTVTVESEPVPLWQSVISGITGGALKFFTSASKEPTQ